MRNKTRTIIAIVAIVAVSCLLILFMAQHDRHEELVAQQIADTIAQNVYFEGDLISSANYNHSTVLCIKVDTASVDSFYHFCRPLALRLAKGVAAMPIGMSDKHDSAWLFKTKAQRIIVNKNHSGQTQFVKGTDTLAEDLCLWPAKLEEVHLLIAWENAVARMKEQEPAQP